MSETSAAAVSPPTKPVILLDGRSSSNTTVILAHGAGAPMDSAFMLSMAGGLAQRGLRVARFEFPYMQARRVGRQPPPDRMPVLQASYRAVIAELGAGERLVLAGKSLGGRVASLIADEVGALGLVCLGYPFHPPGKPAQQRTAHLQTLTTQTLIVQGSRDPFGTRDEIAGYGLSPAIRVHFIEDGDHSFAPRKKSGRSEDDAIEEAVEVMAEFVHGLRPPSTSTEA
jgi:predicted alpha/beta-hydrolase family hydrolase